MAPTCELSGLEVRSDDLGSIEEVEQGVAKGVSTSLGVVSAAELAKYQRIKSSATAQLRREKAPRVPNGQRVTLTARQVNKRIKEILWHILLQEAENNA